MRTFIYILLLFVLLACNSKEADELPNVVFILVDDLGWTDVGFMGSTYYETPNIDALAEESMVFTNAYAGAANCAPSRSALMSGMNSPRTGIYTVGTSARGNKKTRKLIPVKNNMILSDSVFTIAEMFHAAGYVTGHFGKWHIGKDPCTQGFDHNFGGSQAGAPVGGYFAPYKLKIEGPRGEYLTDRVTQEAINFIRKNRSNPFFLYLPYYAVHAPLMAKECLKEKYEAKPANQYHNNATYAGMIENLDSDIGKILGVLNELELENTLIIFTSDNGGVLTTSIQFPLRAGKGSYYEGGIRVPLIVNWAGKIKSGVSDEQVLNMDFFPTFKEIIGYKGEIPQPADGVSLKALLLQGDPLETRPIFFHFPVYLQAKPLMTEGLRDPLFRTRPGSLVIYGDWKFVQYYEDGELELFNLCEDPGEQNNLISSHPEKAKQMSRILNDWLEQTNAPIPELPNNEYDEAFTTGQIQRYRVQ